MLNYDKCCGMKMNSKITTTSSNGKRMNVVFAKWSVKFGYVTDLSVIIWAQLAAGNGHTTIIYIYIYIVFYIVNVYEDWNIAPII